MSNNLQQASIQAKQFILTSDATDTSFVAPSAPPATPQELLYGAEAPPPYQTLPTGPLDTGQNAPHTQSIGGRTKLGYMDFMPTLLKKRLLKDNEYETFSAIVERANGWLSEHPYVRPLTCESISWSGLKADTMDSNQSYCLRSLDAGIKTRHLRGLRIWFEQDIYTSCANKGGVQQQLKCRSFVPRHDQETFQQLMDRINKSMEDAPLEGDVIAVEVVPLLSKSSAEYQVGMTNPELCFWKEDPEHNKIYAFCVHIFTTSSKTQANQGNKIFGYKDFVPEVNEQYQDNSGYETLSKVMDRASRWISSQQDVQFVSIRSLKVKIKADLDIDEHGNSIANLPPRLTSRTFQPTEIKTISTSMPQLPLDKLVSSIHEDQNKVMDRINRWFRITGAKLYHVETVAIRFNSSHKSEGADATYSENSIQKNSSNTEKWVFYTRLYLDGVYREPPSAITLVAPGVSHSIGK